MRVPLLLANQQCEWRSPRAKLEMHSPDGLAAVVIPL
jgi:hypothetical protein